MRSICVFVFAIACSTNHATTQSDRPKDPTPPPATADATVVMKDVDAMPADPPDDADDAMHSLGDEHGRVRNKEWWLKNAATMRPKLRAQLEDGTDDIMADNWAIEILGDIGNPDDVQLLARILTTHKRDTARHAAAFALGKIQGTAATAALIEATKHDNRDTAGYAADGLGLRKGDADARARLEELLDHKLSALRFHAANALGDLGGSKDALAKRQKIEKDAEVKTAITKALKAP